MVERKGVSPVIATVLLIAMVIVIALIIFIWFRNFGGETLTKMGGQNVDIVCDDVEFSAEYIEGGFLTITNTGNVPIYDINIKTEDSSQGKSDTFKLGTLSSGWGNGLRSGGSFVAYVNIGDPTLITVSPILLGTSKDGEKAFDCDEDKTGKVIFSV